MSFLAGDDKPQYTGLQINTSASFMAIPIVIGWGRISPNFVWTGDYKLLSEGSGKGLGKTGNQQNYSLSWIGMLCDGPIEPGFGDSTFVWLNSNWYTEASAGISQFTGFQTAPWSYMEVAHPDQALVYPGQAYFAFANMPIGDSQALPNITALVYGQLSFTGANKARKVTLKNQPNSINEIDYTIPVGDADPVEMVFLLLTQPEWGVPDFPSTAIDLPSWFASSAALNPAVGDATWQAWCFANGISLSLVLSSQETASSVLERLFQLTVTAPVWSGDSLKAIPYGDSQVSGNGYTFTPNTAPVYAFTDADLAVDQPDAEPILIERRDVSSANDLPNCVRLNWSNAANLWNTEPVEWKDDSQIDIYGLHVAPNISGNEITYGPVAQTVVNLLGQRGLYIRNLYTFKLPPQFYVLDPMDLVSLTDPALSLNGVVVRITEITADESGILTVKAEEYPQGVATAVVYPIQTIQPNPVNTNATAPSINPPIIFEPGPLLTGSVPQVWVAASAGPNGIFNANWGGCQVWASTDGESYSMVGEIVSPARMGVTTTSLAAYGGTNPDTGHTVGVTLVESGGTLSSTSAENAAADPPVTLCYLGGEIISFQTATLGSATIPAIENDNIPTSAPYTVTVGESALWTADVGVTAALGPVATAMFNGWPVDMGSVTDAATESDDFGNLTDVPVNVVNLGSVTEATGTPGSGNTLGAYALVGSNPAAGQYSVAAGIYTFNAANAGDAVQITYDFTGPVYTLSKLWRGLYGSTGASHLAGVPFARLDNRIFKFSLPPGYIGVPLFLKFPSFNLFGQGLQDLSDIEPYGLTPNGSGWLGPVASAMAAGIPIDMGFVNNAAPVNDDFGFVTDPYDYPIDLGSVAA